MRKVKKVKCKICGNLIDKEEAYVVPVDRVDRNTGIVKQVNEYYCSKEEYDSWRMELTFKDRLYKEICKLFGVTEIINTMLWKEWKIWNSIATNKQIYNFVIDNHFDMIPSFVSKMTTLREYSKIMYFSAIVKNNIADYVKEQKSVSGETIIKKQVDQGSVLSNEESTGKYIGRTGINNIEV